MIDDHVENGETRRSVRCEQHGVFYNPTESPGCVICQREAEPGRARSTSPLTIVLALLSAVVAILVYGASSWSDPGPITADDSTPGLAETSSSGYKGPGSNLDPAPYRSQIEAVESVLFQNKPAELMTADRASSAIMKLSEEIGKSPQGRAVSTELLFLSGRISSEADSGYSVMNLQRARSSWEEIRAQHFSEAAWFQHSTSQTDQAQTRPEPKADPGIVRSLQRCASDMELLITGSRSEIEAFGEPYVDAAEGSAELSRLVNRWNVWSRRWSEDVDRIGSRMPAQVPFDGPSELLSAYNDLSRSLNSLQVLPIGANDSGMPFKGLRQSRLEQAEIGIRQARQSLSELD